MTNETYHTDSELLILTRFIQNMSELLKRVMNKIFEDDYVAKCFKIKQNDYIFQVMVENLFYFWSMNGKLEILTKNGLTEVLLYTNE